MQYAGGILLQPVRTLVAPIIFFRTLAEENANLKAANTLIHIA